jgi:lambda family phage portal protein
MKKNIIDRVVSFWNPAAGARRLRSRYLEAVYQRSFDAATLGRRSTGFKKGRPTSVNSELAGTGSRLRDRSRQMVRNNPYAKRALKGIAANTVGTGVRPSFITRSTTQKQKARYLWKAWAESKECDFDGKLNFYGIQRLVMRSVAESGEVFVRQRRVDTKAGIPLQLQVLEADFLDITKDGDVLPEGGYIMQGVEFDRMGKRVALWLYEEHPGEYRTYKSMMSQRVPIDQVLHIYYLERPGQIRGIPFGVSAMMRLKDFDEYEDAKLIQQKIAACFAAFVTDSADPRPGQSNGDGIPLERMEPGIIEYLNPGQEVQFGNPPSPEGHDEYARRMLQSIAAGFDVTYEMLTSDLSNVNFSSGRMGWIEFGRFVKEWQNELLVEQLSKDVFDWFLMVGFLAGKISNNITATWTAPGRELIDPQKEIKGEQERVRGGFDSWQNVTRKLGRDPEEVLAEIAEDQEAFDVIGAMFVTDPRLDAARKNFTGEQDETPPSGDAGNPTE